MKESCFRYSFKILLAVFTKTKYSLHIVPLVIYKLNPLCVKGGKEDWQDCEDT